MAAVLAVVATLVIGVLVLAPGALAQSDADAVVDAAGFAAHRGEHWEERGAERLERRAAFAEELGAELGAAGDDVEAALRTMLQRRVDAAMADGRLEAEGAEQIMTCYDTAECPPHKLWRLLRHHW